MPETVEADEVGVTGDQGVQGCVHHVELEEWEPSAKFQQRSCAMYSLEKPFRAWLGGK